MKKILILISLALFPGALFGQVGYVEYDNPVYEFLDRMDALHIIEDYNSFELPKSRREIADYLVNINEKSNRLNEVDKNKLKDFLVEFNYDINQNLKHSVSFFRSPGLQSFFDKDKEKYLYSYTGKNQSNIFINFIADGRNVSNINTTENSSDMAQLINFGGIIRGSIYDNFGFYLKGTNGTFFGDRVFASRLIPLRYNWKVTGTRNKETIGDNYYDQTFGYLTAKFKSVRFKIGRDKKLVGYGPVKYILSRDAPPMDYLSASFSYSFFNFSFFHSKLQGKKSVNFDPVQGPIRNITDKFLVYHRFGFDFSRHLDFGLGEMIVYSDRSIDLSYLNPFNFYKSIEHINQDRDNSFIFLDLQNNSFKGLNLYTTLLIDDMDFGKIGTSFRGNKILFSAGARSSQLFRMFPVDFEFQYLMVSPYVFSHRIYDNNYTSQGFSLVDPLQPNSEVFHFQTNYYPHHRVNITIGFEYKRHGANEVDDEGNAITNHGGDVLVGYRTSDKENAPFLNGLLEHTRSYFLRFYYEPINNYVIDYHLEYESFNKTGTNRSLFKQNLFFKIRI